MSPQTFEKAKLKFTGYFNVHGRTACINLLERYGARKLSDVDITLLPRMMAEIDGAPANIRTMPNLAPERIEANAEFEELQTNPAPFA